MEDPFPTAAAFLDHYAAGGCTLAEMLECAAEEAGGGGGGGALGFMELLNMQDFGGLMEEIRPEIRNQAAAEAVNAPQTPNCSSISSESSEGLKEELVNEVEDGEEEEEDDDENEQKKKTATNKQLKVKKTNQKKKREQRFAFMTKSEVDHLEDGYRWRKYGQKAVKNSPFPRSYYRCTNATCNVKKRVERSCADPTIVVTTYEGQHTHPSPQSQRPHLAAAAPPYSGFSTAAAANSRQQQQMMNYSLLVNGYMGGGGGQQLSFGSQSPADLMAASNGLLQDMVPWPPAKREEL